MSVRNYMQTCITPYRLLDDAMALIDQLCIDFDRATEEKVIVLINAAGLHPSVSASRMSMAHKALGDCYYQHNFWGNALEHYHRGLSLNERLAVKRRVQQLEAISRADLLRSASPDLIGDVLRYPEYAELVEADRRNIAALRAETWEDPLDRERYDLARLRAAQQAAAENRIYDPEHEEDIARRLDALGEPYKSEFYRIREQAILSRRDDDPLSQQDIDLMNLAAMERSAAYREGK